MKNTSAPAKEPKPAAKAVAEKPATVAPAPAETPVPLPSAAAEPTPPEEPAATAAPVEKTVPVIVEKNPVFEAMVRAKVAAGLPRKDAEEVTQRQIDEDCARAAAEKKKK